MTGLPDLRQRLASAFAGRLRWAWLAGASLLSLVLSFPLWAGAIGARVVASSGARRLHVPVTIGNGRAGWAGLVLSDVVFGGGSVKRPLAVASTVSVPWAAVWGAGTIRIAGVKAHVERGGPGDNTAGLEAAARSSGASGPTGGTTPRRRPTIEVQDATLRLIDADRGLEAEVGTLALSLVPDDKLAVGARQVSGKLRVRGGDQDPRFGAREVELTVPLHGLRPGGPPVVRVTEGFVQALRSLALSGIKGTLAPTKPGSAEIAIDLQGSYGGARESLWTARGAITPPDPIRGNALAGQVHLRAARFALSRIAEVLPPQILEPADTTIDAALDVGLQEGTISLRGGIEVSGLSLHHEAIAGEPIFGLELGLQLEATVTPAARRLEVAMLTGRVRDLVGIASGSLELPRGSFTFKDGSKLGVLPKLDLRLRVPRIPCARALESLPGPVVPHLQGFALQGFLEADLRTRFDFAALDGLELEGKVGIDGCRVVRATEEVDALAGPEPVLQVVEVPRMDARTPDEKEVLAFAIGPENPDFVPFERISPHLVNAIMTTEDSGFFKHRGWVTSEFKTALRRNLQGGGFRLGASSITMQTVKNVLLSREKTLSRKLQELFLVWYLEQQLPKERILELYFNAIEFGPRIYGIGAAARHYFGKDAAELGPLEGAFFSSILPSPKRRYVQYCHGALLPAWDKYLRRILLRMRERGRLTEEEHAATLNQTLAFDVAARTTTEKECLDWVKRITTKSEPEPPPEAE
jgi:hypothetical protein